MSAMKLETEARLLNSEHVGERVSFSPEPGVVVEDTLTSVKHGESANRDGTAITTDTVWLSVAHLMDRDPRDFPPYAQGWRHIRGGVL